MLEFSPDTPAPVRELALACAAFVQKAVGVELDLTPDTLPLLDHYLSLARDGKGEVHALVAAAAGAYFGEVVRMQYPSRWALPAVGDGDDRDAWRLEFEQVFLYLYPVALAGEALDRGHATDHAASAPSAPSAHAAAARDGGFSVREQDRPALVAALELLGSVDEDEYYLLSTRFDVLASVADRLIALRQRELRVEELPSIAPDVYARAIDDDSARPQRSS
ncbi:MAG: hypothetical protein JNK05_08660 [Myxococcales bacterium]|nr:hypothetical protein [Myxococcales bacterium]